MLMDIRDYVDSVLQNSSRSNSASLTPVAQTKAFERQNYINNMIKGVLSKVSYALDAIPPSVDISPGPVDNLAFGGLALANKGFKNLLRSGDDVEKLAGAVIKNRVPLTDDFDTAVDIVKSLGQTGKHPQFEDYMKAMDTIKDESTRQLTPQELAKNPAVDAVIERIQPRLNVEDTAKLPTQTGELNSLNPTGNVLAKYNAKERASLPLGKNITSLAQTSSKSPDEMITIYRGVKDKYGSINSGDFITTNPQLAKDYSGGGKVLSKKVRLGDILDDVSEPLGEEYIYRPQSSLPTQVEGLPYYHATTAENAKLIEQNGFQGNVGRNSMRSHGDMQKGVFLYPNNKGAAETFGTNLKNPKVLEARINGKVYDANNASKYGWEENLQTQEIASNPKIIEQLRKDGYVGVTSTELGTPATFVFEPKALNQSSVVPKTNPLVQEASKYKSAEEFVKAQINAYHGTNKSFDKFELTEGKRTGGMGAERTVKNNAIFLSNDRNVADFFGKNRSEVQGGYNRVIEAKIPQDKILDLNKLPSDVKRKAIDLVERWTGDKHKSIPADLRSWLVDQSEFVDLVKSKGFKGVRFNEGSVLKGDRYTLKTQGGNYTTAIFDPKDILTKSQLTDIFNQSKRVQNKGGAK